MRLPALAIIAPAAALAPHAGWRARPPHASSSALSLAESLPFFAAPVFASTTEAPSGGQSGGPQSATVTLRLPLGTLFDGRDYTFVTESNVRGYEWTTREADILLDDLVDAALGHLGGAPDDESVDGGADGSDAATVPEMITDYELSQIVLVPTSDWDANRLGLGNRYDVYDGQQRLVTLNLLLAALRDHFQREAEDLMSGGGGRKAVALAATAGEVQGMLAPPKVRKEDVLRISLRKRDNVLLERILVGDAENGDIDASSEVPPAREYPKLTVKQSTELLAPLSPANARIFHNFAHLSTRLSLLSTRERLRLLDYVVERVHLLVCIPETSRIARNIVMSQGRRGMDNEPVDDFKGLVCFRYTVEEGEMYETFDAWDALAADPSTTAATIINGADGAAADEATGGMTTPVGRDIVAAACLLRASASLRTKIRSRGGDEVFEWERWLRKELWVRNRPTEDDSTSAEQRPPWQGKDFFAEEVRPASVALFKFRTGQWDEFAFLTRTGKGKLTKRQRQDVVSRLSFLRDLTTGTASAKEVEIAVLELLLRAGDADGSALAQYLDETLPLVERWALWMALARPSPMQRHATVFALLDAMDGASSLAGADEVIEWTKHAADEYEFGASPGGRRLATAMLKRMNAHVMAEEKKNVPSEDKAAAATVESIQQDWSSEEEREEWSNRIGNLALVSASLSRKRNAKKSDSTWESQCARYQKEPWLLTRQLAELDRWDSDDARNQHIDALSLMELVWGSSVYS